MRWAVLFRKSLLESVRDWKILVMTLTFAPFFVVLMYFYFAEAPTVYRIVVVNRDAGRAGAALIAQMSGVRSTQERVVLRVREEADTAEGRRLLERGSADLVVEIPADFSRVLEAVGRRDAAASARVRTLRDPANVKSLMAAAFADYLAYEYAAVVTGYRGPIELDARTIRSEARPDEFALYVPALLALAVIMLLFTAAAPLIREKDKGTLVRLRMSNMTVLEWLAAVSATQVVVGLVTVGLTYATAVALGYRPVGSVAAGLVVAVASCLALIGISVVVASFLRTIFDLVTIGCFPFFALMFFSGGMLPLPEVTLATVGRLTIHANDVLPTTHTVSAFGKVLNRGMGLGDVTGELAAILLLTALSYAVGAWLFTRRHMRAR